MEKTLRFETAIRYLDALEKRFNKNPQELIDIVPFSKMLMIFEKGKNTKAFLKATNLYIEFCKKNNINNEEETLSYLTGVCKGLGIEYFLSIMN